MVKRAEVESEQAAAAEFSGWSKLIAGGISVFGLGVVDLGLGPGVIALAIAAFGRAEQG